MSDVTIIAEAYTSVVIEVEGTGPQGIAGGGGAWGTITGTLSDQTDLQGELDGKQDDLTLTTTGSSGASTLIGATLNIPQYAGGGAIDWANPVAINTATTLTIGKHHVISDLGSPADYTVTLPAVSGNTGKLISWEIAAGVTKLITVDGNASETIDGELTRVMWAKETAILSCNGTTWTKVAGKSISMGFSVKLGTTQSGLTSGAYNSIAYDTELVDNGGVFGSSIFTAKRGNTWNFSTAFAGIATTAGANITTMAARAYYNGASQLFTVANYNKDESGTGIDSTAAAIILSGVLSTSMSAGDTLENKLYQVASAGNVNHVANLNFFYGTEVLSW